MKNVEVAMTYFKVLSSHSLKPSVFSSAVQKRKIRIYKTIILPVFLYGCDTWSLTLKEEHILRVFRSRVLWRVSGPKTDEMVGG
jgi:hypothetical protein